MMPNSNKINILMVDDRPENLVALEAILSTPNYNLVSANSGEEALKYLLQEDFALILLDVQMPGLNGFDTARLIKAREKTKHIPIIFITVSNASEHVTEGYAVGAVDYIFKPFHPETLRSKVKALAKTYQYYRQTNRKSEEQILESITDAIFSLDENWCFTYLNQGSEKLFGKEKDSLLGQNIWQEYTKEESLFLYSKFNEVKQNSKAAFFTVDSQINERKYSYHIYPFKNGFSVLVLDHSDILGRYS